MGDQDDSEEDVVIEGSDLYNVLKQIGSPEFECTPVNRSEFPDNWDESDDFKNQDTPKYSCLSNIYQSIKNYFSSNEDGNKKVSYGLKELEIILQLDPLLDDHSSFIQSILKDHLDLQTYDDKKTAFPFRILSGSLLFTASFLSPNVRIHGLITALSLSTLTIYQKYSRRCGLQRLRSLVSTQNRVFHLQRKSLKILRNGYGLTLDSNRARRKFSDLEVNRLQYLQPICEGLCRCIEQCSRTFYKTSYSLFSLLPSPLQSANLINTFGQDPFKIQGEITYKKLQRFYYTCILAQSDMMILLSIVLADGSRNYRMQLKISRIINNLRRTLTTHERGLSSLIEEHSSSKTVSIPRRDKKNDSLKYRDLYMHVDLLSRKLQTAYSTVSSILEDIENSPRAGADVDSLVSMMNEAYKQVDTARDFAEFNILVMKKLQNCGGSHQVPHDEPEESMEREKLPVIFDADPQVMDECFEEYIREEYLRPLCEDDDISVERAKMDELLERNFMRELKGVLVVKYRNMSEREARALLRCRKGSCGGDGGGVGIPVPPPLPIREDHSREDGRKDRRPVPLPRRGTRTSVPGEDDGNRESVGSERFSIKMAIGGRIPAFTVKEETFVGSGENSEEELAGSGCEDDEIIDG
ncbi:uncharacterized protein LOC107042506 [Diachasma alloeum]|uniref:uncharacterized protein LOC107042506 n=1 Tax=Diachasma alloeum TaxID=454923 RepID=UPI0007383AE2|nr:uncharacterized protein LOC107042506 [Diachasma alloeum]